MTVTYELTSAQLLEELLHSDKLLLIDFWAPWCGSCKAMLPSVETIASEKSEAISLLQINVDQFPSLSEQFNVRGLPCILLVRNRQELLRISELQTLNQLKQSLAPWLDFECLALLAQANSTADNAQALKILSEAGRLAPQQSAVHLAYIKRLLSVADDDCWQQALAYIQELDHQVLREPEIGRIRSFLYLIEELSIKESNLYKVQELLLSENFLLALEQLTSLLQQQSRPELKELIVKILNIMPDRKMAHDQRLKLYSIIQ